MTVHVLCRFFMVLGVGLQCVIVVFPVHTHLLSGQDVHTGHTRVMPIEIGGGGGGGGA